MFLKIKENLKQFKKILKLYDQMTEEPGPDSSKL